MKYLNFKSCLILGSIASVLFFYSCKKDTVSKPSVQFTASTLSTEVDATVAFTNQTTQATKYVWRFGDGHTSTVVNPTYQYDSIGTFKVTLKATGDGGIDSVSKYITVKSNNITINDGVGIKELSIGALWSTAKSKLGTDTIYMKYYSTRYSIWGHFVWYESTGVALLFLSTSSVLTLSDNIEGIMVTYPYAGTTKKGIAIDSPKGNVLFYYGSASDVATYSTYSYYDYAKLGITFYVGAKSSKVTEIDLYTPDTKKKSGHPSITELRDIFQRSKK